MALRKSQKKTDFFFTFFYDIQEPFCVAKHQTKW